MVVSSTERENSSSPGSGKETSQRPEETKRGPNSQGRRCCEESVLSTGRPWGGPAKLGLM